ncbi:MAG: alkylphosphonate utilization protein [Streptococcaceae bacterium]|nr:alkylphosphonate utilization protein [Streptococcaceae bacterium]
MNLPACPNCGSTYTYEDGTGMIICPECGNEFSLEQLQEQQEAALVKDSVGNVLQDGDSVTIIKDLVVKGMPKSIKKGTKVKSIRLVDPELNNGHDIDAKVDGFGFMGLKSSVVKKN